MSDVSPNTPNNPQEKPSTDTIQTEAPQTNTATAEKPAVTEAKAAAPAEQPFNVDELLSCTTRYTNKAWYLFYNNQKDMKFIRETPVRATLEARSTTGAEELHKILVDAGVTAISRHEKTLSFTATFETIQKVIKNPHTYLLDAIKL